MNGVKEINIKHTYYFFDDTITIKNLDPNKINIDKNSYKNILLHCVCDGRKPWLHSANSVNTLYLIIDKINGYIEESNANKYLKQSKANTR